MEAEATPGRRLLNELNGLRLEGGGRTLRNTLYDQFRRMEEVSARPRPADAPPPLDPSHVITSEEARRLRDSVLRANRPVNPWFSAADITRDTQLRHASPPHSQSREEVSPPSRRRPLPIKVEPLKRKEIHHHYENGPITQQHANKPTRVSVKPEPKPVMKRLVDFVPSRERVHRQGTQTVELRGHLRELERIEAESRERQQRLQTAKGSDGRSSASTYYFSDDGSDAKMDDIYVARGKAPRCDTCFGYINDIILRALGKSFHPACFRCFHCDQCLDGLPFAVDGHERVFCVADYEKLFVPLCSKCHDPIKTPDASGQIVRVVAMNKEYHVGCYSCEGCGRQLTNEAQRRCYPWHTHLLCLDCNQRWRTEGPLTDL